MTEEELKGHLREWIENELSSSITNVIYADQNAPSPNRPYVTLRITNQNRLGLMDEAKYLNDDFELVHYGIREATIDINIFGSEAYDLMQTLQNSSSKNSVLSDFFHTDEISILNVGAIQNLTYLMDTDFEERAQMDVILTYAQEYTDDVGYFDKVDITNGINDETFRVNLT